MRNTRIKQLVKLMKTMLGVAISAIALAAATSPFAAGDTSAATANATARIVGPNSVTINSNLRFGAIAKPGTGPRTVGLSTANVASVTGAGAAPPPSSTTGPASFTVSGDGARAFTLAIDRTVMLTNTAASGGTLTVTTVNDAACTTSCALSGALGDVANGAKVVSIAGSFSLAANTNAGAYAGTMKIGVTYN